METVLTITIFGVITLLYSFSVYKNGDKIKGIHRLLVLVYYILILFFSLFFAGLILEFGMLNVLTTFASVLFVSLFLPLFVILLSGVLLENKK